MIQLYFTEFSAQAFDSNSQALSSGRMDQVCQRKPDCFTSEFVKQTKVFLMNVVPRSSMNTNGETEN